MIGASVLWVLQPRPDAKSLLSRASRPHDAGFVSRAIQRNLAETLLGDLAQKKGGRVVRELAFRLSNESRSVQGELRRLAAAQGIHIPAGIDAENRAIYDSLAELTGGEFDRSFASYTLHTHHRAAEELQREADLGVDPELRQFASDNLPMLRERLVEMEDAA